MTQPIILAAGEAHTLTLAGRPLGVLVTKAHSKHACMFDWTLPSGFATGLHVHRVQEETFFVISGECDWQIGDRQIRAKPGA